MDVHARGDFTPETKGNSGTVLWRKLSDGIRWAWSCSWDLPKEAPEPMLGIPRVYRIIQSHRTRDACVGQLWVLHP